MRLKTVFIGALTMALMAGVAMADGPAGTWESDGDQNQFTVVITESGGAYAGTIDGDGESLKLSDIAFAGGELSFVVDIDFDSLGIAFSVTGAIDGNSFDGTIELPGVGEFPMAMTRRAAVDLSGAIGTWEGVIGTWEGMTDRGPVTIVINESAGALAGTIETGHGVEDLSEVAFSDGRLSFSATLDLGDRELVLDFDGPIGGDDYGANVRIEGLGIFPLALSRAGGGVSGEPAGEWEVTFEIGGNSRTATLNIAKNDDGALSGNWNSQLGASVLTDLRVDGNSLTFGRTLDVGGQSVDLKYSAMIDGDAIKGTISTGQYGDIPFEGKRLGGGLAALAGTWNLAIDANGNILDITLTIAEEDGNLTGIWGSKRFGDTAISDAIYEEDGAVAFTVTVETPNGESNLSFSGAIDGNTVTGNIDSDFGSFLVTGTKAD